MPAKTMQQVAKSDLIAAWAVLENLVVSLDQMGSNFADRPPDELREALASFVTPSLVESIAEARHRLGQYIGDQEAESAAEKIEYWHPSHPVGSLKS